MEVVIDPTEGYCMSNLPDLLQKYVVLKSPVFLMLLFYFHSNLLDVCFEYLLGLNCLVRGKGIFKGNITDITLAINEDCCCMVVILGWYALDLSNKKCSVVL